MSRRASGFTLIEVMLTVGILGVLASVALPAFAHLQLRSRQAERRVIIRALGIALEDFWLRDNRYPGGTPEASTFDGPWNPALPPTPSKRPWNRSPANGDWSRLAISVEGDLYFSYRVEAQASAGSRWSVVLAYGDLDGDGRYSSEYRQIVERVEGGAPVREVTDYDSSVLDPTNY